MARIEIVNGQCLVFGGGRGKARALDVGGNVTCSPVVDAMQHLSFAGFYPGLRPQKFSLGLSPGRRLRVAVPPSAPLSCRQLGATSQRLCARSQ